MKIAEMPISVLAFDSEWERGDSILMLWTGETAYTFNVNRAILEKIEAYGLLSSFLAYPIVGVVAGREWITCGDDGSIESSHDAVEDPVPSLRHEVGADSDDRNLRRLINGVDRDEITWALRNVNLDPHRIPSLREFTLDPDDLISYGDRVAEDIRFGSQRDDLKGAVRLYRPFSVAANPDIYRGLPEEIDNIGPEITGPALLGLSRSSRSIMFYGHDVTLINEAGDSLFFSYPTGRSLSTLIPYWRVKYNGTEFYCFDPELSRLLMQLLPSSQIKYLREPQERVELLYAVAWQMSLGRWE